jgi:hypothetical protein
MYSITTSRELDATDSLPKTRDKCLGRKERGMKYSQHDDLDTTLSYDMGSYDTASAHNGAVGARRVQQEAYGTVLATLLTAP